MPDLRYIPDVATLVLQQEKCIGCRLCTVVCPRSVFEMQDEKAALNDIDACIECGACVNNCPAGAISVTPGVG